MGLRQIIPFLGLVGICCISFAQGEDAPPGSYTWICKVEYSFVGEPAPDDLELISQEINTELEVRKKQQLEKPCTSKDVHSFFYDIAYSSDQETVLASPYAALLQDLQNENRIQNLPPSEPITLSQPIENVILHFISCLYGCQPYQDLSHIR